MSAELAALRVAVLAAFPDLAAPRLVQYRVVREVAGRLSVQAVDAGDEAPDANPIEVWPGVPGVTSSPTPGELVVVALVGEAQYPSVIARSPQGGPGHTPLEVRIDATTEIRVLGAPASAAAVMRVGAAPVPLAKASELAALVTALKALGTTLSASPDPSAALVGGAITTALAAITITPTTRLEAT